MVSLEDLNTEIDPSSILVSEQDLESIYQKTLTRVREIFEHGGMEAELGIEIMAPYLNASEELSSCNPVQAQVIYSRISKGYSIASSLHSKAVFDKSMAETNLDTVRGKYYLEEFVKYVSEQKSKGLVIKDTDASRQHYLNIQSDVINAKVKLDFYEALVSTMDGWKKKLYSDMGNAKNLVYSKRYLDDLPTRAN